MKKWLRFRVTVFLEVLCVILTTMSALDKIEYFCLDAPSGQTEFELLLVQVGDEMPEIQ